VTGADLKRVLVIAYGNPLRSDDGIAWEAAERLRGALPDSVEILSVHQLTPELAEDASRANLVIFLDAAKGGEPGTVWCREGRPQPEFLNVSHHLAPGDVLALCDQLYGAKPPAFIVSVNGECFDHGQNLSPSTMRALPQLEAKVADLIHDGH
jgi:hydrogenase maturation protease